MKSSSHSRNQGPVHKNTKQTGEIRIIAGLWRGRKLKVHNKEGLRPTTDRLKETLFNWLMMDIRGVKVLDCFAGAGSLCFEAASRGASYVLAIEKDKQNAKQLQNNCKDLKTGELIEIQQADFFSALTGNQLSFDIIFVDPPFHQGLVEKTLDTLLDNNAFKVDSLLYLEQENNKPFALEHSNYAQHFELTKQKKAGQVLAQLYRFVG